VGSKLTVLRVAQAVRALALLVQPLDAAMSFVLFACIPSSCEDAEGAAKLVAAVFARCGGGGGTSGETQQTSGKPPFCHAQPQQQQQQELQLLQQLQPGRQCSPWPCGEATAGLAAASCAAGAAPAGSHRKLCSGAGCGTCAEVSADFEQRLRRGAPCCEIQDTQKESVAWPFAAACCDFLQAAGEFPGQAPCGTAGSEVKGEAEQSSSAQSPQEQHEQEQNGDEVYLTPQAPSGTGDSTRCGTASKEVQNEVAPQESEPAAEIFTETGSAAKAIPAIQASHALPGGTALHRPHQGGEAEGEQEAAQFVVVVNECLSHSLLEVTVEEDLHRHEDAAEREFGEQQAGAARGKGKGRRARAGLSAKAFDGTGATHRGFSSSGRGACAGRCSAISAGSSHGGPPGDPGVAEDCGAAHGETAVEPRSAATSLLGRQRRDRTRAGSKTGGSCDAPGSETDLSAESKSRGSCEVFGSGWKTGGSCDVPGSGRQTWGYTGDRWFPNASAVAWQSSGPAAWQQWEGDSLLQSSSQSWAKISEDEDGFDMQPQPQQQQEQQEEPARIAATGGSGEGSLEDQLATALAKVSELQSLHLAAAQAQQADKMEQLEHRLAELRLRNAASDGEDSESGDDLERARAANLLVAEAKAIVYEIEKLTTWD